MVAPLIGAALVGAAGALIGTSQSNKSSAKAADKQMDFQERLSNTAYQRAMKDMKKAGLNPLLAGKMGGASTPMGAMANIRDFGPAVGQGVSAMQAMTQGYKAEAEIEQIHTQVDKIRQEIATSEADEWLKVSAKKLNDQQVMRISQEIHNLKEQMKLTQQQTKATEFSNVQSEIIADFYNNFDFARVAREFGVDARLFKFIFGKFFGIKTPVKGAKK
jgi:phenylalanyl-tRNA synthetase alpha subunit